MVSNINIFHCKASELNTMQCVLMNWINYCHLLINHLQFTENEEDSAGISSNSQSDARQQYDLGLNVALLNGFFSRL